MGKSSSLVLAVRETESPPREGGHVGEAILFQDASCLMRGQIAGAAIRPTSAPIRIDKPAQITSRLSI